MAPNYIRTYTVEGLLDPPPGYMYARQMTTCNSSFIRNLPPCMPCKSNSRKCLYVGVRLFIVEASSPIPTISQDQVLEPKFATAIRPSLPMLTGSSATINEDNVNFIKYNVAESLQPMLEQATRLANLPKCLRLECSLKIVILCRGCKRRLMAGYMCIYCAETICSKCHDRYPFAVDRELQWKRRRLEWNQKQHSQDKFVNCYRLHDLSNGQRKVRREDELVPFTIFTLESYQTILDQVNVYLAASTLAHPAPAPPSISNPQLLSQPTSSSPSPASSSSTSAELPNFSPYVSMSCKDLTQDYFKQISYSGEPAVLTGMELNWSPQTFLDHQQKVKEKDASKKDKNSSNNDEQQQQQQPPSLNSNSIKTSLRSDILDVMEHFNNNDYMEELVDINLLNTFPELSLESINCLPSILQEVIKSSLSSFYCGTRPKGPKLVPPDLGPKLSATPKENKNSKSSLSLDFVSKLDIMTYSAEDSNFSEWIVFHKDYTKNIRDYLLDKLYEQKQSNFPDKEKFLSLMHDPIFRGDEILSMEDLQNLGKQGVRMYKVIQKKGDAVYIPAGCVYQVTYTPSINVSMGIIEFNHLLATSKLLEDFYSIQSNRKDSTTQESICLPFVLLSCWNAIMKFESNRQT